MTEQPTNTTGPRGTYGCACASRDARQCVLLRYGYPDDDDDPRAAQDCGYHVEACTCLCHEWQDDEDDLDTCGG